MDKVKTEIDQASRVNAIIALPVIIFILLMLLLSLTDSDTYKVVEPHGLLPLLNAIFLFVCPMVVVYVAGRGYMVSGSVGLIMLVSGVFSFALGSLIAGFLLFDKGPNAVVTIHNFSVLLAGLFHVLGVSSALTGFQPEADIQQRKKNLILAFSGIVVLLSTVIYGILQDILPVFFIQGQGPTLLRQSVLGASALSFLISGMLFLKLYRQTPSRFLYWYAMALILIFTGLCCIFIQKSFGSPIGWTGRAAQYVAGLYLLAAVFRGAGELGIDVKGMTQILYKFFRSQFEMLLEERTEQLTLTNEQLRLEIEKRKQAVDSLHETNEYLNNLFDYANAPIIVWDPQLRITRFNHAFELLTGRNCGEVLGRTIDLLFHPDQVQTTMDLIRKTLRGERWQTVEIEILHRNGTVRTVLWNSATLFDAGGKTPIATIAQGHDITERKQAEEALNNERNLIANIMETSPVGITTVDSIGRITFANVKAIAILGLSKDVISQTTYNAPTWHISHLDGKPFPDDRLPFTLVMSTGKAVFDVQHAIHWPDGKRIFLSINGAPMIDANGQLNGMVASIEDITERKQTEENYRTLFREMIDGFALHEIVCDEEGLPIDYRFLDVNPAFERMTGLKAEELVDRNVLDVLPKTERYWIETYGKVALTGEPVLFENYAVELGKHFEVTSFQSAPKQFACIFADITDRKRAEEERAKLEAQLQQAQKMEAIGTLAGGIAHDFNNILAAIIGYTEMAADEEQKEIQQQYLQETLKGAERAKSLVKQILAFSRKDGSEKKPIEFKLLLKETIKFIRASIPTTIEIRQYFTDEPYNIMADATQMHQIVMNLCTNATHAMKQTGGVLKIELSTLELVESEMPLYPDLRPGPYIKLAVSDTGHGVDPILHQRIFDPFFTTKPKGEGTGLGLSVVYGLVRSHDGFINVYSEQGKGASFSVYLPRIIHEEVVSGNLSRDAIRGTERILFVDDEPALVDMGRRMLFSLGYEVTGVTSSLEALDLFRSNPMSFDIVITDMTLPKMTGIELSREILQIRPDIPIVLCSGIRESETEEQVKSLGIRAYCTKPLTRRELSGVIRDILDGHEKHIS